MTPQQKWLIWRLSEVNCFYSTVDIAYQVAEEFDMKISQQTLNSKQLYFTLKFALVEYTGHGKGAWIQSFPFSRPVAMTKLMSQSTLLFTHSWGGLELLNSYLSKSISTMKNGPGFVLRSITVMPWIHIHTFTCVCLLIYIYIYILRESERERVREKEKERKRERERERERACQLAL